MIERVTVKELKCAKYDVIIRKHKIILCAIEDYMIDHFSTIPLTPKFEEELDKILDRLEQVKATITRLQTLKDYYENTTEG